MQVNEKKKIILRITWIFFICFCSKPHGMSYVERNRMLFLSILICTDDMCASVYAFLMNTLHLSSWDWRYVYEMDRTFVMVACDLERINRLVVAYRRCNKFAMIRLEPAEFNLITANKRRITCSLLLLWLLFLFGIDVSEKLAVPTIFHQLNLIFLN